VANRGHGSAKDSFHYSDTAAFAATLEKLRVHYHVPSLSAGIVYQKDLVWYGGFGYADLDRKIIPGPTTTYHLASVTKTFGSIILMQLVEQGKVSLNDPVTKYGINLAGRWGNDPRIEVKHLLTHTAQGNTLNGFKPGYSFRYNGDFYSELGKVIAQGSGQSFGELVVNHIIFPLHLAHTAPSLGDSVDFSLTGYDKAQFIKSVALPYDWKGGKLVQIPYPKGFNPAAGLMSCVQDLAVYSIAIDDTEFLKPATWQEVFTPFRSPTGHVFPYGLGWFVKTYHGVKFIWHTGWWFGFSALFIKVPEQHLAFILLANSQDLSRPFYPKLLNPFSHHLEKNLYASRFAAAFIKTFVQVP
jgi:CubicO group peptidase (beta-lactamase class C family)